MLRKGPYRYEVLALGSVVCATQAQSYDNKSACLFQLNPVKEKHAPRSRPWLRQRARLLFIAWPSYRRGRDAPSANTWWTKYLVRYVFLIYSAAAANLYFWTNYSEAERDHFSSPLRLFFEKAVITSNVDVAKSFVIAAVAPGPAERDAPRMSLLFYAAW